MATDRRASVPNYWVQRYSRSRPHWRTVERHDSASAAEAGAMRLFAEGCDTEGTPGVAVRVIDFEHEVIVRRFGAVTRRNPARSHKRRKATPSADQGKRS